MGGVRWAVDLGADSYGLKGCANARPPDIGNSLTVLTARVFDVPVLVCRYWTQASKPGARYSFYRKSTRGHNTLTFGGNWLRA